MDLFPVMSAVALFLTWCLVQDRDGDGDCDLQDIYKSGGFDYNHTFGHDGSFVALQKDVFEQLAHATRREVDPTDVIGRFTCFVCQLRLRACLALSLLVYCVFPRLCRQQGEHQKIAARTLPTGSKIGHNSVGDGNTKRAERLLRLKARIATLMFHAWGRQGGHQKPSQSSMIFRMASQQIRLASRLTSWLYPPQQDRQVWLHVYDFSGLVLPAVSSVFLKLGTGMFHTTVQVYDKEWAYGADAGDDADWEPTDTEEWWNLTTGVYCYQPGDEEMTTGFRRRGSLALGDTTKTKSEVEAIANTFMDPSTDLGKQWIGRKYHLLDHNCNHFSHEFCSHLEVGPIPAQVANFAPAISAILDMTTFWPSISEFLCLQIPRWHDELPQRVLHNLRYFRSYYVLVLVVAICPVLLLRLKFLFVFDALVLFFAFVRSKRRDLVARAELIYVTGTMVLMLCLMVVSAGILPCSIYFATILLHSLTNGALRKDKPE